ncbi:MAG: apolipoprotein N-acyltransferase [Clostridia bacterium]|nr:apolipoprotein N-acyltransferase [Clostridia bacterium]
MMSVEMIGKRWVRLLLLLVGALLTGLTMTMPSIGFIEWITLIPAAIAMINIAKDRSVRGMGLYGYGFFFFFCYYLVNFYWFIELYPLSFIDGMTKGAAVAVVLAGWLGLSVFQSVAGGFLMLALGGVARTRVAEKCQALIPLAAAALWSIFEWLQTLFWFGVPWARLAIGQTGWLVGAQSASLFGSCFVAFLIVFVNFFAAYAILSAEKRRIFALLSAGVFLLNTALGAVVMLSDKDSGNTVRISVVQGNISSQEKWLASSTQKTLAVYEKYTLEAAEEGAEIVIWPESALPYNLEGDIEKLAYVKALARKSGVTIMVGAFTYNEEGTELNSIVTVFPDGSLHDTVYSKRHLVPFGEYVPMRGLFEVLIPPLTELSMLSEDLAFGEGANVVDLEKADIGSLICFDSIYDELARDSVKEGAQIIALSTNDSWFSDSAALYMHNAQAKLRAIETGRYVTRAANTGISSVITPNGKEIGRIEALLEGQLTADVETRDNTTLYVHVGNVFVLLGALFVCGVFTAETVTKIKKRKGSEK